MISWGAISVATLFVRTTHTFYVLRFLLGAAEAGFFPGVVYYLSHWYPEGQRVRAIAGFMTAVPVSGLIGGPLSGALLTLNGLFGVAGWQWLFLMEGVPAMLLGVIVLIYLTDRPETADWLSSAEKDWLVSRLAAERSLRHLGSVLVDAVVVRHWSTCSCRDRPPGRNRERGRLHGSSDQWRSGGLVRN